MRRLSVRTFDQLEYGNVGAFQPRLYYRPADFTGYVTRMRHQELCFSAFVLGAAIASDNCRHSRNMRPEQPIFPCLSLPQSNCPTTQGADVGDPGNSPSNKSPPSTRPL